MDPFEEFEIKPLSEGLGFHKKATNLSEQVKKAGLTESQSMKVPSMGLTEQNQVKSTPRPQTFDDLLKALETPARPKTPSVSTLAQSAANAASSFGIGSDLKITETLPAPGTTRKKAMEIEIPPPVTPEFPKLNQRPAQTPLSKVVENVGLRRGAADSPVRMLERSSASFPSAILDTVVVFAMSLIFLVALMTITKVDLARLVFNVGLDVPTKLAFAVLFGAIAMMYTVVVRSFFGRTLGEWTFDHQMGDDQQHEKVSYPFKVLWREILVMGTGVILFPLLSLIMRRDLLAPLTGLQLYRSR